MKKKLFLLFFIVIINSLSTMEHFSRVHRPISYDSFFSSERWPFVRKLTADDLLRAELALSPDEAGEVANDIDFTPHSLYENRDSLYVNDFFADISDVDDVDEEAATLKRDKRTCLYKYSLLLRRLSVMVFSRK